MTRETKIIRKEEGDEEQTRWNITLMRLKTGKKFRMTVKRKENKIKKEEN
jgi:hypothetical protein